MKAIVTISCLAVVIVSPALAAQDSTRPAVNRDFEVEGVPLTSPGCAFTDPEFNDGQQRVTYWDFSQPGNIKVLVGQFDPTAGLFQNDTQTGAVHQVSDEPGDKFDAWGFRVPEFGGEVLMMCVIDRRQIAIYRDLAKNGKPWTRIATLALPADAPHTHIYSVEPIAPETGVNGTSWFSLNAMAGTTGRHLGATGRSSKDGSIWVLSLGNDAAKRIARRVDEGATSRIETARYEAESMLGANEVFIYYERKSPETGRGEVRRCRTGIRPSRKSSPKSNSQ